MVRCAPIVARCRPGAICVLFTVSSEGFRKPRMGYFETGLVIRRLVESDEFTNHLYEEELSYVDQSVGRR
jgi:hypothetical protein